MGAVERAESRLNLAVERMELARRMLDQAAQEFAKAHTLAYSAAHPRRTVTFCAAMGSTTLHVSPGGYQSYRAYDYQLKAGESDIGESPAFLNRLNDIESQFGIHYALAGDLNLECKAGEVVKELYDW